MTTTHDAEPVAGIDSAEAVQILPPGADRQVWLAARREGVGGSDVSTLVGLSPYRSRYELWLDKTHQLPLVDEWPSEAAKWGTLLEPVVRDEFAREHGLEVRPVGMLRSQSWPWMLANPDGLCSDGAGYEGKTCSARTAYQWADDQVPDHAELQAQWCMAVTGLHRWHVAVLIGGQHSEYRLVERDDALIGQLVEISRRFWEDHVHSGVEPPADGSTATTEFLAERHPTAHVASSVEVDADTAEELAHAKAATAAVLSEAKAAHNAVLNRARQLLGDAEQLVCGGRVIATWQNIDQLNQTRLTTDRPDLIEQYTQPVDAFDVAAFRENHPEIYEQYRVRRLNFTRTDHT